MNASDNTPYDVQLQESEVESFPARLKEAVGSASVRSFARRAQVSETVLRKYLAGDSEPTRPALISMARAGGVRLEWLATGDGPKVAGIAEAPASQGFASASQPARQPDAQLELGLLGAAVRVTEDVLKARGVRDRVTSEQFADLVRLVFNDMARGAAEDAATEALRRIMALPR